MYVGRRMTRNVVTASPGDPVARAAALMKEHRVHHLPVVSDDALVGTGMPFRDAHEAVALAVRFS